MPKKLAEAKFMQFAEFLGVLQNNVEKCNLRNLDLFFMQSKISVDSAAALSKSQKVRLLRKQILFSEFRKISPFRLEVMVSILKHKAEMHLTSRGASVLGIFLA